jgi:penicillin G amidase
MKFIPFLASLAITILLTIILGSRTILPAPLALLLSPQHGIWQNAVSLQKNKNTQLQFSTLKGKGEVYFDERQVPHIFADSDTAAYFIEGYLHAKYRLWQMEFQTHAAAGRLCEILGEKSGETNLLQVADRFFRRLGMGFAAENSLKAVEANPATKNMCDAYTAGVNAYIVTLNKRTMPIEYKLLGYEPEPWTNLKTSLFLKYMSFDLAGYEKDFEYTAARNTFSNLLFEKMLPVVPDSLDPIIPKGTVYAAPAIKTTIPASADSLYFTYKKDSGATLPLPPQKPDKNNGSNNWAVSGKKTKSGYPILCSDPHLGLNLPSIWYEAQIHTPTFNVYGVSFPCAPGIAIGFNDSIAFGFTNAGRDVRDYYEIQFKDASRKAYWFNGQWQPTSFRIETIKIKGKTTFVDSVAYTVFGPVMYDATYSNRNNDGKSYAVRWTAHEASNEINMFYLLNKACNYNEYLAAIKHLHTPGQNAVFAAKNGDIAIWCQGQFPAKWRRQGDFVMPGTDTSYNWQGMIPQAENPHAINPARGFVSSANQMPADASYPYYLGGSYPNYRGLTINRRLTQMEQITPMAMQQLQTDNYNVFAAAAMPLLRLHLPENVLRAEEKKYCDILKNWNLRNDANEKGATVFYLLWHKLEELVWKDEIAETGSTKFAPESFILLEALLKDTSYSFLDNRNTPEKETLTGLLQQALHECLPLLQEAQQSSSLEWAKYKKTTITHLTKLSAFSTKPLPIGGGEHIINAAKANHGPSWRMVVHLTPETEAYGIYPGGQDGNPGSPYYDTFINDWAEGKYYKLWIMKPAEKNDTRIKCKMSFGSEF